MDASIPNKLGKERYFTKDTNFTIVQNLLQENYPLHWHEFYEIEYIVSGHAVQVINGVEYEFGPGFAVLLTPADMHSYKKVSKDDLLTIHNAKFSSFILPPELQTMLNGISAPLCGYCPEIAPIIRDLIAEYNGNGLARENFILSSITLICIHLFRSCEEVQNSVNTPEREMLLYIREHFLEDIRIDTVAGIAHLSPNYFSECFKKHMGIGFSAYVRKLRLEFAANLLLTSNFSVKQVAYQAGFNSHSNFFKSFKSEYAMTPEEFRYSNIGPSLPGKEGI